MKKHSHSFSGMTTYENGHAHHYGGITSENDHDLYHDHEMKGETTHNYGHDHDYEFKTGPAIMLPNGMHYHMYACEVEYEDGHIHYISGPTSAD